MFKTLKNDKNRERFIFPILGCYEKWCFSSTGNILSMFLILIICVFIYYLLKKKENLVSIKC